MSCLNIPGRILVSWLGPFAGMSTGTSSMHACHDSDLTGTYMSGVESPPVLAPFTPLLTEYMAIVP